MQMQKLARPTSRESTAGSGGSPPVPLTSASGADTRRLDPSAGPALEVAHVLFMDVIGYSKLRMNQQAAIVVELQELVQKSAEVVKARAEGKLIIRPTGDGMALLFLRDLLSPVRCALELHVLLQKEAAGIKSRIGTRIALRMGIHSGSVLLVEDLNAQSEVAGEGIILAQRVMDCGDSGHILLSSDIAERIIKIDPWSRYLKNLGVCHVKHGVSVHLYNLSGRFEGAPCGNSSLPHKVADDQAAIAEAEKQRRATLFERHPGLRTGLTVGAALLLVGGAYGLYQIPALKQSVNKTVASVKTPGGKAPAPGRRPAGRTRGAKNGTGRTAVPVVSGTRPGGLVESIQVPDLAGQTLSEAQQTARLDGLRVRRSPKSTYNTQYGQGFVYQQSPGGGASLARGGLIYVRVSKGDPPDPAENARIEKLKEAEDKIETESATEEGGAGE